MKSDGCDIIFHDFGYFVEYLYFLFWRTSSGTEVDFVLYGPQGLHAFEIKRSATISSKHFKGLKEFKKDYPEAKTYLIYLGNIKEYHGDVEVVPFEEVLSELPNLLKK